MKILIVANGFPTPQDPQWGCFERDQAVALKQMGHEVSILAVDTRYRKYRRKIGISVFHADGFPVFWGFWFPISILPKKPKLRDWVIFHQFDRVFTKVVKKWGTPDLMYAHFLRNIHGALYLKNKYGIPLVGIEHWSMLMREHPTSYINRVGKESYPNVDKLLVVSKALAASIKSKFNVDSEVVFDMLGPEFLHESPRIREEDGSFRFIAVGSLLPIKGYDLLIRSFADSGLRNRHCKISFVGDGPERQRLELLVEECGLTQSVTFLGRMKKEEIVRMLRDSDAFIVSSHSETFGVACIEALSQGLPCIATKCGGPEEILTEKDGVLIEPDDQEALKEALLFMYENHSRYDREDISARCLSRFSPQVIAGRLTQIFQEVVDKRG